MDKVKDLPLFRPRNPGDQAAENTAAEQKHLFAPDHTDGQALIEALRAKLFTVDRELRRLLRAEKAGNLQAQEESAQKLRILLSPRSPFTALSRSLVPTHYHHLFDSPKDHTP
jgi:hypothetical protein